MSEKLLCSIEGGVATLTFNRPAVRNALDDEMIVAFRTHCERLADDAAVRCVVVCGAGGAFVAGGDVAMFAARIDDLPALSRALTHEFHLGILALRRMPKPVIASVRGAVAGAGVSLMAACDLALAADDARFTAAYSAIGTSPDGGATYFLSRCLGPRRALEFLMLSEPIDAARAAAIGLVNRVVPAAELEAQTRALAVRLASGPTHAYAHTKRLIEEASGAALEAQLEAESRAFSDCAQSDDMREGVRAFVAKRAPSFQGR